MKPPINSEKFRQIENAAYKLIAEKGYEATSMLSIAKASKSSNQTLYKWYGEKRGLFADMVRANAERVKVKLDDALVRADIDEETLLEVGARLLEMLVSERAILLNRAAASDHTNMLGRALTENGRQLILPQLVQLITQFEPAHKLDRKAQNVATEFFVTNLVGDLQIRRAIGALEPLSSKEIKIRAQRAYMALKRYLEKLD